MNLRPFNFYRVYLDRSICQMYAMSSAPEVGLLRNLRSFKKPRKENSRSSYVHARVLHKTWHWEVSRHSRAMDVKEMY